jgi:hypothetical protein
VLCYLSMPMLHIISVHSQCTLIHIQL